MRMLQLRTLAIAPLLLAATIPILASLYIAYNQAKADQLTYLTSLADEVLRRGITSRQQLVEALNELDKSKKPPCSPDSIRLMQQMVATSSYLRGIGAEQGGILHCSTFTQEGAPIPLTGHHGVTATGISTWIGARLPFAPEQPFNIYARNGHAVIIHPGVVTDVPVLDSSIALGLLISSPKIVTRTKGPFNKTWLDDIDLSKSGVIEGQTHRLVISVSKENNIAAVAAAPAAVANHALTAHALILVPLGLVTSALFAFGVISLTRWHTSPNHKLRCGLRRGELFMVYQPIVDLRTGAWVGAEALMRWRKRNGTMVPPDQFIAQAEKVGVISQLTQFAIDTVLHDLPAILPVQPRFYVSINLSPQDLLEDGPVYHLQRRFTNEGMPKGSLMLEVTERGLVNIEAAKAAMAAGRMIGASIALDDFGTGYSSLSMLESLDIDTIKIDRAFIASIGVQVATSSVTSHIIAMAKTLGLKMVAEGVETQEQVDYLREHGVGFAQGWTFAKPMELKALLEGLSGVSRFDHAPIQDPAGSMACETGGRPPVSALTLNPVLV
jgi:sensor c-di-GMP phosphodiesterase-like protein